MYTENITYLRINTKTYTYILDWSVRDCEKFSLILCHKMNALVDTTEYYCTYALVDTHIIFFSYHLAWVFKIYLSLKGMISEYKALYDYSQHGC